MAFTPPAKSAVLLVGAAKRKCDSTDTATRCTRCRTQNLDCQYRSHHRGRRAAGAGISHSTSAADRIVDTTADTTAANTTLDTLSLSNADIVAAGLHRDDQQRHSISTTISQHRPSLSTSLGSQHDNLQALPPAHAASSTDTPAATPSIRFSHVVPIEGDSWPYIRKDPDEHGRLLQNRSQAYDGGQEHIVVERLLASPCPDPVQVCILTRQDAAEMFETYFSTLNLIVPMLDPILCKAETCQEECPLLFTAVLTITSKLLRPRAYRSCLLLANKLLGQCVEHGQCSVMHVQAILLLVHFKEHEDSSGWRRVGYAIRMALELRINEAFKKQPSRERASLSSSSEDARLLRNAQRVWLNLLISDYHMAIHHSLPRMITDDGIEDADAWLAHNTTSSDSLPVRGENILPALIEFSRMCRLYADLIEGMNGDPSNLRLLAWLEQRWQQWRRRYQLVARDPRRDCGDSSNDTSGSSSSPHTSTHWHQLQYATLLLCDAFFRFHLAEYKLLYRVRYGGLSSSASSSSSTAFTADLQLASSPLSLAFHECVEAAMAPLTVFLRDYQAHGLLPFASNILWVALAVTSVWLVCNVRLLSSGYRQQLLPLLASVQRACQGASRTPADPPAYMYRLLHHLLTSIEGTSTTTMDDLLSFANSSMMRPAEESVRQMIQEGLYSRRHSVGPQADNDLTSSGPATPSAAGQQHALPSSSDDPSSMLFPATDDDFWKLVFPII